MAYTNNNGQVRIGVRSGITNSPIIQPAFSASLLQSLYGVWNGDTTTNELDKSLFGVWNGETTSTVTTLSGSVSSAWNGDNFYSTSGITASNVNNVTLSTGKIGNAFTFNGSNYVSIPSSVMNFTGDFTVNFWIKINSTAVSNQGIMGNKRWSLGPGGFEIIFNNGWLQALGGNEQNGASGFATNGNLTLANATTWTMVTFIYRKGVSNSFYINAGTSYTTAHQHTLLSSIFNGQLGSEPMDNYRLNGNLDAVTFWDRAITQNEIYALYNSTNGREYPYPSTISVDIPSPNDSFGTNHGSLMNGCTYTTGKIGNAFTFDGVNDYVALPDNIFNFTGDFSASAWFYTPSAAYGHSGIVGNYNWGTKTGWGIYTYQNRLYCEIYNSGGGYSTVFIDNSVVGSWNHVTMVFKKGTGFYLYMNGELKNSFTLTNNGNAGVSPVYSATQKSYIGLLNYSGDWWYAKNGYKIDGVNVWQRAILQNEITQLYNSGTGTQYPFTGTFSSAGNQLGVDNGTLVNGCSLTTGKVGQAFTFDGVNDFVQFPNNSLNLTNNYSINLWLYLPSAQSTTLLSVFGNDGFNKGFYIDITSLSSYTFRFVGFNNNSNVIALNGSGGIGYLNRWSMATLTVSGTSVKIYLDGTLASSGEMSVPINYTSTTYPTLGAFRNGNGTPSSYLANGTKIDGLSVWQKELTQSEVTELYNSGNGKQITATPIVQTGLVLNLDASRSSSYTGTGTTWTDISGNGNNGTFTNGPVFGTASGGVITFDGVNDYVSIAGLANYLNNKNKFSYETWFKVNSTTSFGTLFSFGNNDNYSNDIIFFVLGNQINAQINNGADGGAVAGFTSTGWNNMCVIYDGTQTGNTNRLKLYLNGVQQTLSFGSYNVPTSTSNTSMVNTGLGAYSTGGWNNFISGSIATSRLYTVSLTDSEVLQNYNATKSRFGL